MKTHLRMLPEINFQVLVNRGLRQFFQVDWSPNGKHLVFSAETLMGNYGLYYLLVCVRGSVAFSLFAG